MSNEELILKYFEQTLTPEEKMEFEHLLATNPEFNKEVEFQKLLKVSITRSEYVRLKQRLQSFESEIQTSRNKLSWTKWMTGAAAAIIIIVSSVFFINHINQQQDDLFDEYYTTFANVANPIVRGKNEIDTLTMAYLHYELGQYDKSINYFKHLSGKNEILYMGLAQMELEHYEEAIQSFKLIDNEDFKFKNYVKWYMGLAYLKTNKTKEALSYFNQLKDDISFEHYDEVIQILNKLD